MKEALRCCISCILPCGALDVIRIVHSNGRVEEISKAVRASDIMKANPKHVLRKSSMMSSGEGLVPQIVVLPPEAELERGKIYFLMPVSTLPEKPGRSTTTTATRKKKRREHQAISSTNASMNTNNDPLSMTKVLVSDRYLSEILSERISTQRDRRRGRVGVWRPHLESISEVSNDL